MTPPVTNQQRQVFAPADAEAPLKQQGVKAIRLPLTQKVVLTVGLTVLCCLVVLPVSDAIMLLHDFNYIFWSGQVLPTAVIIVLVSVLFIYLVTSGSMGVQGVENYKAHHLSTLVTTFSTLLGVILVLASLVLHYREQQVISALSYNCQGTLVSSVRQSYQNLLNLRLGSQCAHEWSIETCPGYAEAASPANAAFLKACESTFHCSGFCYVARGQENASLVEVASQIPASFLGKSSEQAGHTSKVERTLRTAYLPPALFSQSQYKTTCNSAAARNLTNVPIAMSKAWWWMAIALIGASIFVSFAEWLCASRLK